MDALFFLKGLMMKILEPLRWFPLDHSLIPTLADLGKKRLRYVGPFERQPDGRHSVHLAWDGKLTQKQYLLTHARTDLQEQVVVLSTILGSGTKCFRMTTAMQEQFAHIEIPLTSAEISIPFPGCIVDRPDGRFHLVAHDRNEGVLAIQSTPAPGSSEFEFSFLLSHQTIEDAFRADTISVWNADSDKPHRIEAPDFPNHQFRATINFLMWLTTQGVAAEKRTVVSNKMPHHYRTAIPRLYRPQQVQLFRPRYESDDSAGDGTSKRPHWRRMHWRHIPCGKGKAERKLALIESTFVNKDKFVGDLATTIYTAV